MKPTYFCLALGISDYCKNNPLKSGNSRDYHRANFFYRLLYNDKLSVKKRMLALTALLNSHKDEDNTLIKFIANNLVRQLPEELRSNTQWKVSKKNYFR